jgi:hypothetical protein
MGMFLAWIIWLRNSYGVQNVYLLNPTDASVPLFDICTFYKPIIMGF